MSNHRTFTAGEKYLYRGRVEFVNGRPVDLEDVVVCVDSDSPEFMRPIVRIDGNDRVVESYKLSDLHKATVKEGNEFVEMQDHKREVYRIGIVNIRQEKDKLPKIFDQGYTVLGYPTGFNRFNIVDVLI